MVTVARQMMGCGMEKDKTITTEFYVPENFKGMDFEEALTEIIDGTLPYWHRYNKAEEKPFEVCCYDEKEEIRVIAKCLTQVAASNVVYGRTADFLRRIAHD